jgi:diadenylate cyclase
VEWLTNLWYVRSIIIPILDVAILTVILYKGYQIFLQTRAISLIRGVIFLLVLYGVAFILQLRTLLWLLNFIAPSLLIGVAIIFQPELRKIFIRLGQGQLFHFRESDKPLQIESVLKAASVLSDQRRGALVVFVRNVGQKNIVETGSRLDAELSPALLITIFGHDTPLHDGATVVENGRIVAAGAFLPLSEQQDIRRSFGTRHRAALGLAEESDAVILVVSEETGAVSLAYDSVLHYNLGIEESRSRLGELLNIDSISEEPPEGGFDEK